MHSANISGFVVNKGTSLAHAIILARSFRLPVIRTKDIGRQAIDSTEIKNYMGDDEVQAVAVQSMEDLTKTTIPCRAVFIQAGLTPNTAFCDRLVELNEKGEIKISADCSTSVEGVFACGDVTDVFAKRIVIASGEGAKAALNAKRYLARRTESIKR